MTGRIGTGMRHVVEGVPYPSPVPQAVVQVARC